MLSVAGAARVHSRHTASIADYLIAGLAVAIATLVRWLLDPALSDHLPYVTYFVAVAFVAWRCGLGPSLFALLAGWWAADFFFFSPRYVWYPHGNTPTHIVGAATYFMVGLSSIAVCEAMRRAQRHVEQARELLQVTLASIGDAVVTTDTQGRVASLKAVAEALTGWTQNEAVGRPLQEVFHIINEETRRPVENPAARVLAEGKVVGLANHIVLIRKDGTERTIDDSAAPILDAEAKLIGVVLVFRDVTEQRRLDRALHESEARKAAILETALDCIITIDHEGKVVEWNPACEQTFGYSRADVVGREMAEIIVPDAMRERHRAGMTKYLATGEGPVLNRRIELTALRSDGTEFPVELSITSIPSTGNPLFTAYLRDITGRKRAEDCQRLLADELDHRVKNTLAIMQSIATQTARFTPDPQQFHQAFSARLVSMSRIHDILTKGSWTGADLHDLVETILAPYRGQEVSAPDIGGPAVLLPPNTAVAISLVLHELATNAAKYGALSQPSGRVHVTWKQSHGSPQLLTLEWRESGGPPVGKPARQGFGTRLIEMMASQLAGKISLSHKRQGVVCRMEIPLDEMPRLQ